MNRCNVCGNKTFHDEHVDEVFRIDNQLVLVEHIPAHVCERCDDFTFDRETVEQVRLTVHSEGQPIRQETLDVFAM